MAGGLLLTGLVGSALLVAAVAGCSVRVGSGGPPPPNPDDGTTGITTACSRDGSETKLAFGGGSQAFAWLWDTDHYVVAYSDPSTGNGDIFVAKMGADGTQLAAPVDVQPTAAASDLPSIVKTSAGYVVVWQEGTAGQAVLAQALDANAAPVASGSMIASTQSNQSRPVLSQAPGGKVAATWMDVFDGKGGAQVALVDPTTLTVTGPQRIAQADIDGWPWVAGDDQSLAVAWSDDGAGSYDVQFASLDPQSLAMSNQISLRGTVPNSGLLPRLIRTSFGFFAAWEDMRTSDNQIFSSLVDPTGHSIGGGLVEEPNTGDANWPNAAWDGSGAMAIVYYQWRTSRPQIYLTLLDSTGARVNRAHDLMVSNGDAGWSKYPDVLWTGSEFGVLYVDTRDGPPALWLQRVSCTGS